MPIENIDCPQFVDFTSGEAFMMDDGADFCFDKRVVGSEDVVDLGFFNHRPAAENRPAVLKENNNSQTEKGNVEMANTYQEPVKNEPLLLTPKKPAVLEKENKENISGVGVSKVGSALDLINAKQSALMSANTTNNQNNQPQVFSEHNKPPSAQCNQASNGNKSRIRTLSSANAVPSKSTTEKPNSNVLPISGYKGIRFLPKQPISSVISTPSKDKKQGDAKKSFNTTATNISTSEASSKSQHQPRIVGGLFDSAKPADEVPASKPANLLRATSVKSYGSKHSTTTAATPSTTNPVTTKPPNLIATLKSNLMRVRTQAKPPAGPVPSSSVSSHDISSMMSKKLNMNESANASRLNGSMVRKKSESKSGGLLHTEMRAMKRSEYDQQMREKERMAQQMRAQIEAQKAQQEHEELTRMRSQSVVKAQPLRYYKPIDIKPSEQPLTAPRSPNFIAPNTSRLARSNSRSNITTSASSLPNNQSHLSQSNFHA